MSLDGPAEDGRALNRLIRVLIASLAFTREVSIEEVTASGLLASIRADGIRNPPLVRETPEGPKRYEILAGNGRVTGWGALGHSHVDVINLGPMSLAAALRAMALDHTIRREMGSPELTGYAASYMREMNCTALEAMAALNITGSNRTKVGVVLNGPPECLQDVLKGDVPASTAYEVMHRVRTPTEQIAWFKKIVAEKLTRQEVIDQLKPRGKKAETTVTITVRYTGLDSTVAALVARAEDMRAAKKKGLTDDEYALLLKRKKGA